MRYLVTFLLVFPALAPAAECEALAKLKDIRINSCVEGKRADVKLEKLDDQGQAIWSIPYDEVPMGIEKFWAAACECNLWQITGIGGAHTRIARFYRETHAGLVPVKNGEFGSELGQISRVSNTAGLFVEENDLTVDRKHQKQVRYFFDGQAFRKMGTGKRKHHK